MGNNPVHVISDITFETTIRTIDVLIWGNALTGNASHKTVTFAGQHFITVPRTIVKPTDHTGKVVRHPIDRIWTIGSGLVDIVHHQVSREILGKLEAGVQVGKILYILGTNTETLVLLAGE